MIERESARRLALLGGSDPGATAAPRSAVDAMILVDTSIWIDHLHRSEPSLAEALEGSRVVQHPMVIGELALGTLRDRARVLELLANLPQVQERHTRR